MPAKQSVHRGLSLTSPFPKGEDIRVLQGQINKTFRHFNIDRKVLDDGEFGPATLSASRQAALLLGVVGKSRRKLKKGRVTMSAQKLIRGRKKSPAEAVATKARKRYRDKLRKRFDRSGGKAALAWAKSKVGVTESPAGSNWGPEIGAWIRFTGYSGPVYWCGCFCAYATVKIGGARIPSVIRLGYDGYIRADAASHSNGLTQVGFSEARAGDIVVYVYPHIELVESVSGDTIKTIGGNTSPQNSGGSSSNGGGVFARQRSRSEVACIARPNYS